MECRAHLPGWCLAQVTLWPTALTRLTGASCLEMHTGQCRKTSLQLIGGMLAFGISVRTSLQGSPSQESIETPHKRSPHVVHYAPRAAVSKGTSAAGPCPELRSMVVDAGRQIEHQKSYLDLSCKRFLKVGSESRLSPCHLARTVLV